MTFRWYGDNDPVTLLNIRQIPGMTGIVSAVYDTPPGEVWPQASIDALKKKAEDAGLAFEVVESVPVHEEIKLGGPDAPRLIENYCETLSRLGKAGVKVVCYNFMPVFDWLRSTLDEQHDDGSNGLSYIEEQVLHMNPLDGSLSLPGWDESYGAGELKALMSRWQDKTQEDLWKNFEAFLNKVVPAAEQAGIRMAIHPDDPPWGIFGLPRIITGVGSYRRMMEINDSPANGITLCTGSLGASGENDVAAIADEFAEHIPFVHLRNILRTGDRCFKETAHPSACGSLDMYKIVKTLVRRGFDGYVRPDHGRMIWGEQGRPGYGLYDRALGAAYLTGLFEAAQKEQDV